jgi:hypothetical protein
MFFWGAISLAVSIISGKTNKNNGKKPIEIAIARIKAIICCVLPLLYVAAMVLSYFFK